TAIAAVVIGLVATRMNTAVAPIEPAAIEASSGESRADEPRYNAVEASDSGERRAFVPPRKPAGPSASPTNGTSTTIRGRVVDEQERPLSHASVHVIQEGPTWMTGNSDDMGGFEIHAFTKSNEPFDLLAKAPDYDDKLVQGIAVHSLGVRIVLQHTRWGA